MNLRYPELRRVFSGPWVSYGEQCLMVVRMIWFEKVSEKENTEEEMTGKMGEDKSVKEKRGGEMLM